MICLHGKTVCGGMASGNAYVFYRNTERVTERESNCPSDELNRLEFAVSAVKDELIKCGEQAQSNTAKEIFEIHRMMLEDDDVLDFLHNSVQNDGLTAEKAVRETEKYFSQLFRDTQDDYMIARIDDIRDVCGRLTAFLSEEEMPDKPQGDFILVADELLPADLMRLSGGNLKGIIVGSGSVYSHVSILIKEMGIPALICENIQNVKTGMTVLINAESGTAYFEPDESTVQEFLRLEEYATEKKSVFHGTNCRVRFMLISEIRRKCAPN